MGETLFTAPPDYVGVGTQRSGTTWWQRLLRDHPRIRTARDGTKEQHFFDQFRRRPMQASDIAAYHELFPRTEGELAGEWTPRYMRDIWAPPLLAQAAPDARLLVMFRDPVERYRSGILHTTARQPELGPVDIATDSVDRGRYAAQLRRIYDYFEREQVLLLQFERCLQEPLEEYHRTLEFLGLPPDHLPTDLTRTRGTATKSRREPIWDDIRYAVTRELEADVEELRELMPELDVALWRNFKHLADGSEPEGPARPSARPRSDTSRPPDYVGVGTSDAGCAWWHRLLLEHPLVGAPAGKRTLNFFGEFCTRAMTEDDVDAYHAAFPREAATIVGEWSPNYIHEAWTPMLLHRAAPNAKLLVMLCDPVARYASSLAELLRRPQVEISMSETLARGRYASQLRGLLRHFDRGQILVLQFERCVNDPVGESARTLSFLGVPDGQLPGRRPRMLFGRKPPPTPPPPKRQLAELWPDLHAPLVRDLEPEVRELAELIPGLDLSLWPDFAHLAAAETGTEPL